MIQRAISRRGMALCLLAVALISQPLSAQRPASPSPTPLLAPREVSRSAQAFVHIAGARELGDGRVLLTDGPSRVLLLLDSTLRASRSLGRSGDGPAEYRSPSRILPIGLDSSILVDASNRRWRLLVGDQFSSLGEKLLSLHASVRGELGGASNSAVLYLVGTGPRRSVPLPEAGRAEGHEYSAVVLYRIGATPDTIARGRTAFWGFARKSGRAVTHFALHPLNSSDQAALFLDGRVAIVTLDPYAVEWRSPTGRNISRTVVAGLLPPVTQSLRREIANNYVREADGYSVFQDGDFAMWPDRLPAFTPRSVIAGLDGRLYVSRTKMGESARQRIDVFSSEHGFEGSLQLLPQERLLTVGRRWMYTALQNEDEEEVLVRYQLVSFRQ
jgi:hypothetical protein